MRSHLRVAGVLLAAAAVLSGCGNDPIPSGASSTPTPQAPAPSSAAPSTLCTPAFTANTQPDSMNPVGGPLGMQSASATVQTDYDQVVFQLGASGQPGWLVEYVTSPTSDGSGDPIPVAGTAFLRVVIKDVGYEGDTGIPDPPASAKRFTPTGTVVVKEVVLDTVYEGEYHAFIGVTPMMPFRVTKLANPARVVVDIRHC